MILISVSDEYKKLVIELQILSIQNFHNKKIFIYSFETMGFRKYLFMNIL